MGRAVAWAKDDEPGVEWAEVDLGADRFSARGVAIGIGSLPFRLDYTLDTTAGWVTARLSAEARGDGWHRSVDLRRTPAGAWVATAGGAGAPALAAAGGATAALAGALDCDLGGSPLTNSMPVLRNGLLVADGEQRFLMAFVEVPSLAVRPSRQGYATVGRTAGGLRRIRYRSLDGTFTSVLTFDADGLVVDYPQLGHRVP